MNASAKPRVLFVVDVDNWAYGNRAKHWQALLADEFAIDVLSLKQFDLLKPRKRFSPVDVSFQNQLIGLADFDREDTEMLRQTQQFFARIRTHRDELLLARPVFDHRNYDGILFFYHKALRDKRLVGTPIPPEKIAVCINNEKWEEDGAEETLRNNFSEAKIVIGCNQHIVDSFSPHHPCVMRVSQVIDPLTFKTDRDQLVRPKRIEKQFVVGWSGDYKNPIKNVDILKGACKTAGVKLLISKNRSREELNEWYNSLVDTLVCVSKAEGGPLMLLEAGACTRPVISTPVGLAREIIRDGETGIIVPQGNDEKLIEAIQLLAEDLQLREKLAVNLHQEVMENWTFEARLHEIQSALRTLCDAA